MRRILVFQPDAAARGSATLPVGVVREDGLVPRLQVIVKATFGFAPAEAGGPPPPVAALVPAQEAIAFEKHRHRPSDLGDGPAGPIVPADAAIEVKGGRAVRLPGITPQVSVEGGGRAARPLAVACDSLWIDDANARLVAVWRARLEVGSLRAREVERITVALERGGAPLSARRPGRASYSFAVEADGQPPGPRDAVERARLSAALIRAIDDAPPEPSLSLERYAAIAAELAEKREPPAETLARHELDGLGWMVEERAWLARMTDQAIAGETALASEYGAAFLAAQDRLGRPEEARFTLADYIEIRARLESNGEPAAVLAARKMTLPEWMRLDRRWSREGRQSPELGDELERLVKEAKSALLLGGA